MSDSVACAVAQDVDDDVVAASAAALVPLVPTLRALGPAPCERIAALLWQQLEEMGALSPSSASCMELLAALYQEGGTLR